MGRMRSFNILESSKRVRRNLISGSRFMAQCGDDVLIETTFDYTLDCGESGRGSGFQWRTERHLSLAFSEKKCAAIYIYFL